MMQLYAVKTTQEFSTESVSITPCVNKMTSDWRMGACRLDVKCVITP